MSPTFLIIDSYLLSLWGTEKLLNAQYPDSQVLAATDAQAAKEMVITEEPHLVICNLSISLQEGQSPEIEVGLLLLKDLMQLNSQLNIVVQGTNIKALIRMKTYIDAHQGGFTVVDKCFSEVDIFTQIDGALKGLRYVPAKLRVYPEIQSELLQVLELAFNKGLQDKEIAEYLKVSRRTVRNYWLRIQDIFNISPQDGYNMRIKTEISVRKAGFLG
ncbi:HTH domain-containing protein [Leptothoe sp. LEGE 181152]|nr:HTH domain-containing protein [Leptothoe sp. LEGE 181152]